MGMFTKTEVMGPRSRVSPRYRVGCDCRVRRVGKDGKDELVYQTRTLQAAKDECDINSIMKRFEKTGQLPEMIRNNPSYGDFSEVQEYRDALDTVRLAEDQFAALNSHLRGRFRNDPALFLEFCSDPANQEELVKLGLATKREVPAPPKVAKKDPPKPKVSEGKKSDD